MPDVDTAERVLEQVGADPNSARCIGITGPGGTGKSALLTSLAATYRRAGMDVRAVDGMIDGRPDTGVLLLDDAHLADPTILSRLRPMVGASDISLVVAMRPWPRCTELSRLVEVIRQRGQLIRLEHLSRAAVERRAAAALETAPSGSVIDALSEQTGGLPCLVDEVLDGWRHDPQALNGASPVVPARVLERLHQLLDGAGSAARAVLLAAAIGFELDPETTAAVLEMDTAEAAESIAAARATGFLLPDGQPVPLVTVALLRSTAPELVRAMRMRSLDAGRRRRRDVVPVARQLARSGVRHGLVADVLTSAADRLRPTDPTGALELYADAVDAGAPAGSLALRRADSAARSGQLDLALQLVDTVLADVDGPDFCAGMELAATVMAHRGELVRAGELYEWLGPERISAGTAMAAIALMSTGRRGTEVLLEAARPEPTFAGGGRALMARGLRESLDGHPAAALSTLMRAAALLDSADRSTLLPDTPSALAALIAIHTGDLDIADSILTRAVQQGSGGDAAWARHRLLSAWVAMLRGRLDLARQLRTEVLTGIGARELTLRDEVFARALDLGVARRSSDAATLVAAWQAGQDALLRLPVDLFTLLPLGEFWMAAARLRQSDRVRAHLDDAWTLLHRLDDPHVWGPTLRWCGVQAAILGNRPDEVEPHAAALLRAAHHSRMAAAMAAAGRAWLHALAGDVVPSTVEPAARGLQEFGLAWDGSRLLAQAAALSTDRQITAALLHAARALQPVDDSRESSEDRPTPTAGTSSALLSERELEVARLLLQRQTYREIGQQLFISPKTVEHHVARIKQRLGATGRADLLARLRAGTTAQRSS